MATLYVRKTGNDTTGNGTTSAPYLTINRAISGAAPKINSGDTLLVGAGTYAENGGSGYFEPGNFASATTIRSESGNPDEVVITSPQDVGGSLNIYCSGNYVTFRDVTLQAPSGKATVSLQGSHLAFQNVKLVAVGGTCVSFNTPAYHQNTITFTDCAMSFTGAGGYLVYCSQVAGRHCNTVTFTRCRMTLAAGEFYAVTLGNNNDADLNDWTFDGCTISSTATTRQAFYAHGITNLTLTNCSISSSAFDGTFIQQGSNVQIAGGSYSAPILHALSLGSDSASAQAVSGAVQNAAISCGTGHALLVGYGSSNIAVSGCTISGGDYGLVIKHNSGATITGNTIKGGTLGGLYFKAATNATAQDNTIQAPTGKAVCAGAGDGGAKCQNITLTNNRIGAAGAAGIYSWVGDAGDAGGCVVDYNLYWPNGSAKYGAVRADNDVSTMDELHAAWAGYGDGSNDSHSGMWKTGGGGKRIAVIARSLRGAGRWPR